MLVYPSPLLAFPIFLLIPCIFIWIYIYEYINYCESVKFYKIVLYYDNIENYDEAEKYYLMANNNGHIDAMNNLAIYYDDIEEIMT